MRALVRSWHGDHGLEMRFPSQYSTQSAHYRAFVALNQQADNARWASYLKGASPNQYGQNRKGSLCLLYSNKAVQCNLPRCLIEILLHNQLHIAFLALDWIVQ